MEIQYSADLRSAVEALGTAAQFALDKFREQPRETARSPRAQEEVGVKLRKMSRVMDELRGVLFPEMATLRCSVCHKSFFTERAYWSGSCYGCALQT